MTSARLPTTAPVRNRLFPKIRSWFALGAPMELLSPLSVLRLVFLVEVAPAGAALALHPRGGAAEALAVACAGIAGGWIVLVVSRTLSPATSHVLCVLGMATTGCVVWSGDGRGLAYAAVPLFLPLGVFTGLFFGLRAILGYQMLAWAALAVALWPTQGADAALVAGLGTLLGSSATLTVAMLTRSARSQERADADTGLPNGFGLADRLGSRPGDRIVVSAVSVAGLGDVREALGYQVGTELLRRVVEDLGQVLPREAVIGRVAGDELVVVLDLPGSAPSSRPVTAKQEPPADVLGAARELAAMVTRTVDAGRYLVDGVEISVRAHVGLALGPWHGRELGELVRRASLGASRATRLSRGSEMWDPAHRALSADDFALLADLRVAAERGQLWVAYQPQCDARSRRTVAVEALMRWDSPTRGQVSPGHFVPLAERTGLIDRLTEWVLGEALDAQVRWRRAGLELPVSVNLSAKSLANPDLPSWILSMLDGRRLPPESLVVEVTETMATPDLLEAVTLLRPLHEKRVRVSIDDFGTGYTSLAVLPHLPLDELKVDQRFVLASSTSAADEAIVQSVRELAHRLGLVAVAEGVENAELASRMTELGFDVLQGYHHCRPLAEHDLLHFVGRQQDAGLRALPGRPGG
ncbi:MAG: putative bifunctional diguanylate cyclase/phosphodiesterase [Acidimicrobiales bacterium]